MHVHASVLGERTGLLYLCVTALLAQRLSAAIHGASHRMGETKAIVQIHV